MWSPPSPQLHHVRNEGHQGTRKDVLGGNLHNYFCSSIRLVTLPALPTLIGVHLEQPGMLKGLMLRAFLVIGHEVPAMERLQAPLAVYIFNDVCRGMFSADVSI